MNLEAFFGRSRGPREPPRHAPEVPKGPRGSPITFPKPSSDRKLRCVENVHVKLVKPSCLIIRGSAWELEIHPERLRKKRERSRNHLWQQESGKRATREFQHGSGNPLVSILSPRGAPEEPPGGRDPRRGIWHNPV